MISLIITNPVQFKISSKFTLNRNDIDPDKYFYKTRQTAESCYYLEYDFNQLHISNSRFSVLHINARSLNKNIDNIKLYLSTFNHTFAVLAISETWEVAHNLVYFSIPGYSIVSIPRNNDFKCRGGGVALYVRDDIKFDTRSDLYLFGNTSFECVFIETVTSTKQRYIDGCIYRPPDQDMCRFNEDFDCLVHKISSERVIFF